jgi:hypothetical protein
VSESNPSKERPGRATAAALAASLANRLRLIQTDFADEGEDARRGYLADEIERTLGTLVPGEREAFLERLKELFPTWDGNVRVPGGGGGANGQPSNVQAPADAKELKDPSFLVSRLVELAPSLNAQQREALTARLAEAGLVASGGKFEWPAEHAQALRTKLQAPPQQALDAARVLELLGMMVEFTGSLDQLVWTTWRTIAPRSAVKRSAGMLKTIGRFAAADHDVPRGAVAQDLDRLRQLVAAMISAISQAGRQFAHAHAAKFNPDEIESLAAMERGSMFASKESKCWNKYRELATGRDEASIEAEIMQAIAEYAVHPNRPCRSDGNIRKSTSRTLSRRAAGESPLLRSRTPYRPIGPAWGEAWQSRSHGCRGYPR